LLSFENIAAVQIGRLFTYIKHDLARKQSLGERGLRVQATMNCQLPEACAFQVDWLFSNPPEADYNRNV